jgi:transposase
MKKTIRHVGFDVHKDSIAIGVADEGRGEAEVLGVIPNELSVLLKHLKRLGPEECLRCCYEAGPTGYGLYRELTARGISCVVVAPSLVPVQAGNKVKTDRRDAAKLARFLRSGDLTPVYVPDEASEAMRDLERARDDAKKSERVARHQLGKFLLRHGRRYDGGCSWTQAHLAWIRSQTFEHEAQKRVLVDYLHTVEEASSRVTHLEQDIGDLVGSWSQAPLVKALQALRGISLMAAVIIVAELGDLSRFKSPRQLMAYLGLVPSEHSSGGSTKRGRITRTGNAHARWVLIESAWSYRFGPRMSEEIRRRNKEVAPGVRKIAWKAQLRLHKRYTKLLARGKNKQRTITAVARELAGFIWAISREPKLLAS